MAWKQVELKTDASMKRFKPVCSGCGSDNVVCQAHAEWDTFTQQWVLGSIIDDDLLCGSCGSELSAEWKEDAA